MASLARILLPVDFSERSVAAARYAALLGGHFRAEVTVLHVLTPPRYSYGTADFGAVDVGGSMIGELSRSWAEHARKELECLVATELSGLNVQTLVLEGEPAEKIVEFAHQQAVDLILMPTHGYGPFRRFILGSNTAKVLHDADCPVWTGVHMAEAPANAVKSFHRVLCAIDLGAQSSKTLCWAATLAREFGASLSVLHVTASDPDGGGPSGGGRVNVREAAGEELLRLQRFVGAEAQLLVEAGEPPQTICSAAARLQADLLVIGRGSAAGVFGRLRTNAYAIIRQSPCPVVSV